MLLSESQERMLMVAKEGREQDVFDLCKKWDLDAAIIGRVTDTSRFVCTATANYDPLSGEPATGERVTVVDIPVAVLTDDAPRYDRPQSRPAAATTVEPPELTPEEAPAELLRLVGSPNLGSRRWIWRQYDHIVQNGTVFRPGESDAAVVRVVCEEDGVTLEKFLALSVDCNGRHVELDPWHGAAMAVAECARNVVCSGAKPLALTDCLNFGNPEKPETMWRFSQAIDGLRDACLALDTPVVSGNVSLYNETDGRAILPTPTVGIVGQLRAPEDRLPSAFQADGDHVALLGEPGEGCLGGSEWLTGRTGTVSGPAQTIDLKKEAASHLAGVVSPCRCNLLYIPDPCTRIICNKS
jgi:phosphoribosylformylglycinamidine synthase